MRRSLLLLVGFVMLTSLALAQQGQRQGQRQSPEEMAKTRADLFQEEFGLSDEQRDKTEKILLTTAQDSREKMLALRESASQGSSREAMREEMQSIMKENRETLEKGLKEIFNEQQWLAYEKWKKENPPQQRRRGGGNF
jgi:hypothetical protein